MSMNYVSNRFVNYFLIYVKSLDTISKGDYNDGKRL